MLDKLVQFKWRKVTSISAVFTLSFGTVSSAIQNKEATLTPFKNYQFEHYPYHLAQKQRRTALVIGNGDYGVFGTLKNSSNDATDMAQTLRELGFDVTLLQDADKKSIHTALENFNQQLKKGGVGLFYFAGHAFQIRGQNYLIPVKADINREQDVQYEAVPLGKILGAMEEANNPINLVFLDACRNNPYNRGWRSVSLGLAPVSARGTLISFATGPGDLAADGEGRNSPFTESLLKHIKTPGLAVELMLKRVRQEVQQKTQGEQSPWEQSNLVGEFAFKLRTAPLNPLPTSVFKESVVRKDPLPTSVPTPKLPPTSPLSAMTLGPRYRVVVSAFSSRQKEKIRELVPGAFRTSYRGQSVMLVGLFGSEQEAQDRMKLVQRHGMHPILVKPSVFKESVVRKDPLPTSVPTPKLPPTSPLSAMTLGPRYRVVVSAFSSRQKEKIRELFPDAFRTSYRGQSVMQVGVFGSEQEAQDRMKLVQRHGMHPILVKPSVFKESVVRKDPLPTSVPTPKLPPTSPLSAMTLGLRYRVVVSAFSSRQKEKIRELFPDAFRTSYRGQSVMQVGVFGSEQEAQDRMKLVQRHGMYPILVKSK